MKRPLKPEELRVWSMVAATVHPLPGREAPKAESADAFPAPSAGRAAPHSERGAAARAIPSRAASRPAPPHRGEEKGIEPGRKHRIAREREEIGGRIDLHGLTQDRARAALEAFLQRAWGEGYRAVLVITGKGVQGDGVLKRHTPSWLAAPHLAHIVAGISEAHRRHGGEGALYVALKRKARGL